MQTSRRIPALDGLRGVAALMVLLEHTWGGLTLGPLGVDIFFVLSGFLIGGILMDTTGQAGWVTRFYTRRTLRIWPLYFVVVALFVLSEGRLHPKTNLPYWPLWTFWVNVADPISTYVHQSHPQAAVYPMTVGILWSVCIEEHAYFILPPLVRFMKRNELGIALGLSALLIAGIRYLFWVTTRFYDFGYTLTCCRLDSICIGMLAAWIFRYRRDWIPKVMPVGILLIGVALGTVNQPPFWSGMAFDLFGTFTVQSLGAAALILGLVDGRWPPVERIFSAAPLRFLGTISYCMYVIHPLIRELLIHFRMSPPVGPWLFFTMLPLTIAVASLSWYGFERPILNLSRRFASAAEPATATTL